MKVGITRVLLRALRNTRKRCGEADFACNKPFCTDFRDFIGSISCFQRACSMPQPVLVSETGIRAINFAGFDITKLSCHKHCIRAPNSS